MRTEAPVIGDIDCICAPSIVLPAPSSDSPVYRETGPAPEEPVVGIVGGAELLAENAAAAPS